MIPNISRDNVLKLSEDPLVESIIFDMLQVRKSANILACLTVIGEIIATTEDKGLVQRYLHQHKLLEHLHWVLLEGNIKHRKEAILILSNLACSPECVKVILEDPLQMITSNILLELKRQHQRVDIKKDCMYFLTNLLANTKGNVELMKVLVVK